jgi:hypothetical protein
MNVVPTAVPQPEDREEILTADMAALTDDDIPRDEDAWAVPDPGTSRPAELEGLTTAELDDLAATGPPPLPEILPAGSPTSATRARAAGTATGSSRPSAGHFGSPGRG